MEDVRRVGKFELRSTAPKDGRDGQEHIIDVFDDTRRVFRELTFITGTGAAIKFPGWREAAVAKWLDEHTTKKALARISAGLFQMGEAYAQNIDSEVVKKQSPPVPERYLEQLLLRALLYIRKADPLNYSRQRVDLPGLAAVAGVEDSEMIFAASLLQERMLIGSASDAVLSLQTGHLYITSAGIDRLRAIDSIPPSRIPVARDHEGSDDEVDVAISFAGEQRDVAKSIAEELRKNDVRVFYDDFEKHTLWGRNLGDHLQEVYSKARFCLMLVSTEYAEKAWPNYERRIAQARALRESREYLLPVRLDNTPIRGLLETVAYISYPETSIEEMVELIKRKLATLPS